MFVLLLFTFTSALAQEGLKKDWDQSNPLQWADFQGQIDQTSPFFASTSSGITYTWHVEINRDSRKFTFTVKSFMDKSRSWTKVEKQTPELLKHEQIHFDISEFFARKLQEALNGRSYTDDYKNEIGSIYLQMLEARSAMEAKYDDQTNHSINKTKQAIWERYVSELLSNNYAYKQALEKEPGD